jgi:hypothetical protein
MAVDDLNSFTMQGVVGGLLLTCLLAFAIGFMYVNNPTGLGDSSDIIGNTYTSSSGDLLETSDDADTLLNITSNTNPEVSDLGSRDSVATSYSATGTGKSSFESAKELISWVFSGTPGKLLLGTLTGIIGLLSYFFIYKHIRQGN